MRHQLSTRLGVRCRPGRKAGWEIAHISDTVIREFSQRRNEIDDALRELEAEIGRGAHPGEVEHIVLRTRPAKNHTPAAAPGARHVTVDFDGIGRIDVSRSVSTSRVDATATRAETYVDITRGRDQNHLYLTTASDPLDGEALPRAPTPPADVAVADRLHRSTGELTAWELAHPADDAGGLGRAIGL